MGMKKVLDVVLAQQNPNPEGRYKNEQRNMKN